MADAGTAVAVVVLGDLVMHFAVCPGILGVSQTQADLGGLLSRRVLWHGMIGRRFC